MHRFCSISAERFTRLLCLLALLPAACVVSQSRYDAAQNRITELERQLDETSDALGEARERSAEMQRALEEARERRAAARGRIEEYRDLVARFQEMIDAGKLNVKIVDGRMVVELPSDVLFARGSARLSREGAAAIREVTEVLIDVPDKRFQAEGHTDSNPIIQPYIYKDNWELGAERALTVVRLMRDVGLPADRVSAASFAASRPVADNATEEGRARNRRIEIVIVPDLENLPGYDELQQLSDPES